MKTRELLKSFYLFRGAEAADLAAVEAVVEPARYAPGEAIFHEGDEATAMYLVELGTIEVVQGVTVLATLGSGGAFGELAFFDPGKRSAAARTREASHVIGVPFAALTQTLAPRPALALVFHRNACAFLARRLRQTSLDLSFSRELNRQHL